MKIVDPLFYLFAHQGIQMFLVDAILKKQENKVPNRFPSCNNVNFQCVANFHLLIKHTLQSYPVHLLKTYTFLKLKVS